MNYNASEILRTIAGRTFGEVFGREPTTREMDVIAAHRLAREAVRVARTGSLAINVKPSAAAYRDAQEIAADADRELAALIVRARELEIARRRVRDALGTMRARQVGYFYGAEYERAAVEAGLHRALLHYRALQSVSPAIVA